MSNTFAWFKEYYSLLSKRAMVTWLILLFGISTFFFVANSSRGPGDIDSLFAIAAGIGWLLITGIPFLFGASLLFTSQETKNNIVEKMSKGNVKFSHLFVIFIILILFNMAVVTVIGFSLASLIAMTAKNGRGLRPAARCHANVSDWWM